MDELTRLKETAEKCRRLAKSPATQRHRRLDEGTQPRPSV